MNLQQIAVETKRMVENARGGKLEGWGEGNFTITNLGMFGVEEFAAIVNPPEPGILAVGAVREAVIVKDGAMKPGTRHDHDALLRPPRHRRPARRQVHGADEGNFGNRRRLLDIDAGFRRFVGPSVSLSCETNTIWLNITI